MKAEYIKPEIKLVEIDTQAILAVSSEIKVYRGTVTEWEEEEL